MGSHFTPFLLFGGAPAPATFILRSAGGGGNILRSPDDGSKIERSD